MNQAWTLIVRATGNRNCQMRLLEDYPAEFANVESMIGLHRQSLQLEESHQDWPNAFQKEKARIKAAVSDTNMIVEHIGSTAVPGLLAKPIIDIGILLDRAQDKSSIRDSLVSIKYIYRGDKGSEGGRLFVRERETNVRTHHLHVVMKGDPAWDRYIRFRDALRADEDLRRQYASLKQCLASDLENDRAAYTRAKTEFISDLLRSL